MKIYGKRLVRLRQFDEFHVCISDACTLQKINAKLM